MTKRKPKSPTTTEPARSLCTLDPVTGELTGPMVVPLPHYDAMADSLARNHPEMYGPGTSGALRLVAERPAEMSPPVKRRRRSKSTTIQDAGLEVASGAAISEGASASPSASDSAGELLRELGAQHTTLALMLAETALVSYQRAQHLAELVDNLIGLGELREAEQIDRLAHRAHGRMLGAIELLRRGANSDVRVQVGHVHVGDTNVLTVSESDEGST